MDLVTLFTTLLNTIFTGGTSSAVALLVLILAGCIFIIRWLAKSLKEKDAMIAARDEKYQKVIEGFYTMNKETVEAMNNLRIVLVEIRSKL